MSARLETDGPAPVGEADQACGRVLRALAEAVPGAEPEGADVRAHVSSCLACYRASQNMRAVGALVSPLRAAETAARATHDPGPAFWAALPGQIAAARKAKAPAATSRKARRWTAAAWRLALPAVAGVLLVAGAAGLSWAPRDRQAASRAPVSSTAGVARPATATASGEANAPEASARNAVDLSESAVEALEMLDDEELAAVARMLVSESSI